MPLKLLQRVSRQETLASRQKDEEDEEAIEEFEVKTNRWEFFLSSPASLKRKKHDSALQIWIDLIEQNERCRKFRQSANHGSWQSLEVRSIRLLFIQ